MSEIGDRIHQEMKLKKLSYGDLSEATGIYKSALQRYVSGSTAKIPMNRLELIAQALSVSPEYLMGWSQSKTGVNVDPFMRGFNTDDNGNELIPVLGEVRAGYPAFAEQDILGYEYITAEMASLGDYFGLRIKGDNMEPVMSQGDIVIVKEQTTIESGQIAIVVVNGDEATCKKVVKKSDGIILVPMNSFYEPMYYTCEEVEQLPVTIIGRVVELRKKF